MSRAPQFSASVKRRAVALYLAGASLRDVAERCVSNGRVPSHEAVRLWLRASGVDLRERGRPKASEERELVTQLGKQGLLTAAEIASAVGVSPMSVYRWLSESGVERVSDRGRRTQDTRSRIVALLNQGMAPLQIADELGLWFTVIYKHMRAMGVRSLVDRRRREFRKAA